MNDERKGLLHASIVGRVSACPGSFALEKSLEGEGGAIGPPASRWASSGWRIAQYLAREPVQLTPEELTTATMCTEDEGAALAEWNPPASLLVSREKRYWLREKLVPIASAQPDFVAIDLEGNRALVLNHKSGRLEPEASPKNLQLRTEAVCLQNHYSGHFRSISVGIVQPWVRRKVELVSYDAADLSRARQELLKLAEAVKAPDAPLALNEHCKFCPAAIACPLLQGHVKDLWVYSGWSKYALPAAVSALEPGAKLDLFKKIKVLGPALKTILATLAAEVEANPGAIPGLKLERGDRVRKITDLRAAENILKHLVAFSDDELAACKTLSISKLEALYGAKRGLAGKLLRTEFNRAFDAVIEYLEERPSLSLQ